MPLPLAQRTGARTAAIAATTAITATITTIAVTAIAVTAAARTSAHRRRFAALIQPERAQADGAGRGQREMVRGAVKLLRRPRQHHVQRLGRCESINE